MADEAVDQDWLNYFKNQASDLASTAGTIVKNYSDPNAGLLSPLNPLIQGATFGAYGALNSNYAKYREAHPLWAPFGEALGMTGSTIGADLGLSAVQPELGIPMAAADALSFAPRAAKLAKSGLEVGGRMLRAGAEGAAEGALGTNVTGGDAGSNAFWGAALGAGFPAEAELWRTFGRPISRRAAEIVDGLMDAFGTSSPKKALRLSTDPRQIEAAKGETSKLFQTFANKTGGVDLTMPVAPSVDSAGRQMFPAESLQSRITNIFGYDVRGAPGAEEELTQARDALAGALNFHPTSGAPVIEPEVFDRVMKSGGAISNLMQSKIPDVRMLGGQLSDAMYDALEKQMPDAAATIRAAKNRWKGLYGAADARQEILGEGGHDLHLSSGGAIAGAAGLALGSHFLESTVWPVIEPALASHPLLAPLIGGGALGAIAAKLYGGQRLISQSVEKTLERRQPWGANVLSPETWKRPAAVGATVSGVNEYKSTTGQNEPPPDPDWLEYFKTQAAAGS